MPESETETRNNLGIEKLKFWVNRREPDHDVIISLLDKIKNELDIDYYPIPCSGVSTLWVYYHNSSRIPQYWGSRKIIDTLNLIYAASSKQAV